MNKEILAREKFIWDDLIADGKKMIGMVREMWRKDRKIPRMMFSWPSEHLESVEGKTVTHIVSFAVPKELNTFEAAVGMTKATKAYALLLVEQEESDVRILLESFHGTRCWRLPIRRHGDIDVLEKENASEDTETLGILWRRSVGQS